MDAARVAEVDARLDAIPAAHDGARILWAIESGSRAWGFPSPDSDFDCRFVFVRRRDDYLRLFPLRDVIETPLTATLDVNGWDLAKAIRLMLTGNAVIVEWLTSPIVYRGEAEFRDAFLELGAMILQRERVGRHYLYLGRRMQANILGEPGEAKLKKVFYALRPAVALRWLRLNSDAVIAPMHFPTLCREAELPPDATAEIDSLIQRKAATRELGTGAVPQPIIDLIHAELSAVEPFEVADAEKDAERYDRAEAFFRSMLVAYAPSRGLQSDNPSC
jgi:uncharacterized protein